MYTLISEQQAWVDVDDDEEKYARGFLSIRLNFLQKGNQWAANLAASMKAKKVSADPPSSDT